MYQLFTEISNFLSGPFFTLVNQTEQIPLLASFLLGLVGALAPCQLTGNLGAITYYGNRSLQTKNQWIEIAFFIFGKILVFTLLGLAVWIVGQSFQQALPGFFSWFRKLMGPLFILIGLSLIGLFTFNWINRFTSILPQWTGSGKTGSFLMGVSFSIAFCPTMFSLFFFTLMPIVLSTSYGAVLPSVFAIGTSIPLIIFAVIISYIGLNGSLLKKGRKLGSFVQKIAGYILIIVGIFDTVTYWGV
ncbi:MULTISPECIES: sulfite exporter TauE/SafE family protein [unclassified Bacillus (in: firmicutes)]|uniref:urease accessory protein UreH domain-containing protein n=1 Tax=unclassified Bacillus (in: firmicutes) TaxID=185979 RepID=UPI001BE98A57|nr:MULTISPECIES: sulfite exporter TauE/SafE family protein [unclassified Bacillus (in: firmicutes)]MBT2639544.1 sulfite exporter TauE/SafE family protein [Bacillus sp. ISL-39]MBT2662547.1 sulfite exporter TauE/SafE family protein [Bacillus sp. ISL-45]